MNEFNCPHCKFRLTAPDSLTKQIGRCVSCKRLVIVPDKPPFETHNPLWYIVALLVALLICAIMFLYRAEAEDQRQEEIRQRIRRSVW